MQTVPFKALPPHPPELPRLERLLTELAQVHHVSASTQNQAFNERGGKRSATPLCDVTVGGLQAVHPQAPSPLRFAGALQMRNGEF